MSELETLTTHTVDTSSIPETIQQLLCNIQSVPNFAPVAHMDVQVNHGGYTKGYNRPL